MAKTQLQALAPPLLCAEPAGAQSDDRLVERALQRPPEFAHLYERHLNPVYRYLVSRTGSRADAEDLTAQVFLAALESLGSYRPGTSFRAWLFGIARRKSADFFRKRRPAASLDLAAELPAADGSPLAQVIRSETLERLAGLVDRLNAFDQELLRLRYAGHLGFAEIARVMGKSESAVKMAHYRLLARLEAQMEEEHD